VPFFGIIEELKLLLKTYSRYQKDYRRMNMWKKSKLSHPTTESYERRLHILSFVNAILIFSHNKITDEEKIIIIFFFLFVKNHSKLIYILLPFCHLKLVYTEWIQLKFDITWLWALYSQSWNFMEVRRINYNKKLIIHSVL
jgi:hypothetical protein